MKSLFYFLSCLMTCNSTNATQRLSAPLIYIWHSLYSKYFSAWLIFYLFLNSFLYVISLAIFLLISVRPDGVALQWLPKAVLCVYPYSSTYQVVLQLRVFLLSHLLFNIVLQNKNLVSLAVAYLTPWTVSRCIINIY